MFTYGKIALSSFLGLFVLTRIQTALLKVMQPGTWTPVVVAAALSLAGVACVISIFVCFWLRVQQSKKAGGKPVPWEKWIVLSLAALVYASDPIASLIGIGTGLGHSIFR